MTTPDRRATSVQTGYRLGEKCRLEGTWTATATAAACRRAFTGPRECGLAAGLPGLLERVPAIVYIAEAGETGRWHYVSPQIEHILGFTPRGVVQRSRAVGRPAAPR